jgi:hypothetical protein
MRQLLKRVKFEFLGKQVNLWRWALYLLKSYNNLDVSDMNDTE